MWNGVWKTLLLVPMEVSILLDELKLVNLSRLHLPHKLIVMTKRREGESENFGQKAGCKTNFKTLLLSLQSRRALGLNYML